MTQAEFLEELENEVIKLNSLLKDKQLGLFSWWNLLEIRLERINNLTKEYYNGYLTNDRESKQTDNS